MMEKGTIELGPADNRLAGLDIDLKQKLRNQIRSLDDFEWFLKLSEKDLADFQGRKPRTTLKMLYKEAKKVFDYTSDIVTWFTKAVNKESSEFKGKTSVTRFKKDISHEDIIKAEKKAGTYQEFTLLQGIRKAIELVENGEIEKRGKGVIIYLSTKSKNNVFCGLFVYRDSDGGLELRVNEVSLRDVWDAGDGVLSCNKSS